MGETYITDEMRAEIGKEQERKVSFPVERSAIRQWGVAVRWPEPPERLYWDEEYARTTRFRGIIAPPFFNPFAYHVDEDRMRGRFMRGPLERTPGLTGLNGGGDVEYYEPIRPGDVITSVSRITDLYERDGRLGRMLFTLTETVWTNQRGELVRVYRNTNIKY